MGSKLARFKRKKSPRRGKKEETRSPKERRRQLQQSELPKLIGGSKNGVLSNTRNAALVPQLQASLSTARRCYDWKQLYSLTQHGCSLHTLLLKVHNENPTLVVVETTKGEIFGGFVSEAWRISGNYYGLGESFVFAFNAKFECYPWSCSDAMVMFSNEENIAMGGGGGFAWCLNSDLSRGTSGCSTTFGNACLTTESEFGIVNVEVWGFTLKM
ncbi:hypothetical protein PHMEG_0007151 [Phytophthora megakarya]|uniref:Oxidation resistance protein 1 n=1 Tax=Phytophthora megakarya TaxID=4795 RepID=A0A225WMC1_9STRA|nr:hypothetical protein PHMEG_0007151 [Phytophthora megakarya]